jgi:hypothetical protein
MKICWDMLEGVHLSRNGVFIKGYNSYVYKDSCVECSEPYLTLKYKQSRFCGLSCTSKNRVYTIETRRKMSVAHTGKIVSIETRKKLHAANIGKAHRILSETRKLIAAQSRATMLKRIENGTAPKTKGSDHSNWKGGITKKNLPLYDTYAHQIDYVHEVKSVVKDGFKLLEIRCKNCNKWFVPKTNAVQSRIGALAGKNDGEHNFYCSDECKNSCSVFYQHVWPKDHKPRKTNKSIWYTDYELRIWRDVVLKRENHICEYCGGKATIAHHNKPKKLEPFFALDPDYGTACCEKCHYKYGHQGECNTANLAHVDCN